MECIYTYKQKTIELDNFDDKINIFFFGDVHRDTPSCDADRWRKFLKDAKETPDSYFFAMGDLNDFASTKEKKIIDKSELHDTTKGKFDYVAEKDIRRICAEMSFMRGRMLGVLEGNHSWIFKNGKKSDENIAERMASEYCGWLCAYTLILKVGHKGCSIHFVLCHGRAGGKRAGTSINQVEDLKVIFPAMDVYVQAHDHNRGAWPVSALIPIRGPKEWHIKQKRQWLCRSGSFKKGYMPDTSGYEIGRLLRPSDLGALQLQIGLHRSLINGGDIVYPDIKAII